MSDDCLRNEISNGLKKLKSQILIIPEGRVTGLSRGDALTILQICQQICCKVDTWSKSVSDKKPAGIVLAVLLTEIEEPMFGVYPDLLPEHLKDDDNDRYLKMCASKKYIKAEYIDFCLEQLH